MSYAIAEELKSLSEETAETINTVYFGGGTPSILSENEFQLIFDSVIKNFPVSSAAEITVETNPDDLSTEKLKYLKNIGVNRLSIGIQSLSDELLRKMNRSHTAEEALSGFERARQTGFENISTDLIYGLPGAGMDDLKNDLNRMTSMDPEHISIYGLTIEDKTVFGNWNRKGLLDLPDEDMEANQYELIMEFLESKGYRQYEISNFGKPGRESKHNRAYWQGVEYLGAGPGAHSFVQGRRWKNISNNSLYIQKIGSGESTREYEERNVEDMMNEYILTSLRTMEGISIGKLEKEFGQDILAVKKEKIDFFIENKWILNESGNILLTRKGKLLADQIASELFIYLK